MSLPYATGLTAAEVVAQNRQTYGSVPVARIYSSSIPARWTSDRMLAALGDDSDVIFSFQGDLDAIAAGAYDERMRAFLAGKPAGVNAWIVLHHEPEDDVARGHFTAAQFKAATAHIAPVIRSSGGIPTTVLMAWTLKEASGRDWRDFYSPAIDVLAFDAYNTAQKKEIPTYKSPEKFLASVLEVKAATGKDFGFAEFGSPCIVSDPTCTQRAAWLTAVGTAMQDAGAEFMAYWNRPAIKDAGVDFTLDDPASLSAWRQLIAGS